MKVRAFWDDFLPVGMEMTDSGIPLARVAQVRWKSLIEAGTVFYNPEISIRT
jgi:hypothetical protein